MEQLERRYIQRELRAEGEDDERRIIGYAAVFNSLSQDLGGFREMILPGAFRRAVDGGDVRALINHEASLILGRTVAGTLVLEEDDIGLRYEILPPGTRYAEDLITSVQRGDVDQSSFSFKAIEESWRSPTEAEPLPVRILREVDVYDVSPVTFPAYPVTSVQVRDMAKELLASAGRATGGAADEQSAAGRLALMKRRLDLVNKH